MKTPDLPEEKPRAHDGAHAITNSSVDALLSQLDKVKRTVVRAALPTTTEGQAFRFAKPTTGASSFIASPDATSMPIWELSV